VNPSVMMAIGQFKDMGFKLDVEFVQEHDDLIREVLRHQPDIFIMDMAQAGVPAPEIIRQLRGFVIVRDMTILVYSPLPPSPKEARKKGKKTQEEIIIQKCLEAGAAKIISPWDRETFLSVLFQYCRN